MAEISDGGSAEAWGRWDLDQVGDLFQDFLRLEAGRRATLHINSPGRRPLSDDYELVGLVGEAEFADVYDLPLNLKRRPGGDGGIDFVIPLAFTVDVKCFRKAFNLIQEVGKVAADIYVLAEFSDARCRADLVGWEYGSILAKAPVKAFSDANIQTHYIARAALRPMRDLGRRIMRLKPLTAT